MIGRVDDVFCDQSGSGSKLQHLLMPHDGTDESVHLPIRLLIFSHEAVIDFCCSIPERFHHSAPFAT